MAASVSEALEAPGGGVPFSLDPILVEMDRGLYVGPILPIRLADLVSGGERGGDGVGKENGLNVVSAPPPRKKERPTLLGGERGCWCDMMRIFPPCPFGTGRTCGPSW